MNIINNLLVIFDKSYLLLKKAKNFNILTLIMLDNLLYIFVK